MAEGKKGFFGRLVEGLTKTRNNIVSGIDSIFSGFSAIDDDFYEDDIQDEAEETVEEAEASEADDFAEEAPEEEASETEE